MIKSLTKAILFTFCGLGIPSYEEQFHILSMHKEEDKALKKHKNGNAKSYITPKDFKL